VRKGERGVRRSLLRDPLPYARDGIIVDINIWDEKNGELSNYTVARNVHDCEGMRNVVKA
jgi:hypothetical protein